MKFSKDLKKRLIKEGFVPHFVKDLKDAFEDIPTQEFARFSINQLGDVVNRVIHQASKSSEKLFKVGLAEKTKIVECLHLHQTASMRATDHPEDKDDKQTDKPGKSLVTPKPENKPLHFKVQLIEADTKDKKPLPGFKVKVSLVDGKKTREIVKTITDKNGNFSFHHLAEKGKETEEYEFNLVISDSQGNEVHTKTISVKPPVEKTLVVKISMSEYRRKIAVPIENITEELRYNLPSGLFSFLRKNNIETLEDIRKNKGIKHLKDLPVPNDHPDINRLEGHAYLHTLSKNIHLNGFLIKKGYTSPSVIGDGSLAKFIKDTKTKLKKEEAERLWKRARKQNRALDLMALTHRISKAKGNGKVKGGAEPGLSGENREPCVCKECDAAVSPRAYLVQLLDYAVQNLDITDSETEKDIFEWLSDTFCLHFDDFSFSCEAMEEEVLQIRLCIEVLRYYIDGAGDLEETEKAYCLKAYETLLTQIGTSRDELRLMRNADPNADDQIKEEVESLERRLGFRLRLTTENENRLQEIYLHRDANRDEITEVELFKKFGLLQTVPGARPSNEPPLVAKWRKEYLKEQWGKEDRRESETTWNLPIIDPDLISLDDLRLPNHNTLAFDLWKKRREWIDERINKLAAMSPNIFNMFKDVMVMPITYDGNTFGPIEHLTWHEGVRIRDERRWLEEWIELKENLPEESFERLIEIRRKDINPQGGDTMLTSEEIKELISILIQSQKSRLVQTWKDEEGDLLLGSAHFWLPLTEPSSGEWPPMDHDTRPLINPDFVEKKDLRDVFGLTMKNGKTFIEAWEERQAVLRNLQFDLLLEQENIAGMVYLALKRTLSNATDPLLEIDDLSSEIIEVSEKLDELYNDFEQASVAADSRAIEAAESAIKSEYSSLLTIEEFKTLIEIKQKAGTTNRPTTDQWTQAVAIIKSAFKKRAGWKLEEKKDNALSFKYWEILKAELPKWRADAGTRQKWQAALKANSSMPIIEPDVIFSGDITDSTLLEKREVRLTEIDGIVTGLRNPSDSSDSEQLTWFKSTLINNVGFLLDEFDSLSARYNEGQPVSLRLRQIGLPIGAFLRLNKLYALIKNGQALYVNEVGEVKAVLSSVLKRRLYAKWRKEEANIILDPDKFSLDGAVPEDKPEEWYAWRFDRKARKRWRQTLEARSAQLDAIDDGLKNAVLEAEEAALPILRSGLIDAAYNIHFSNGAGDGDGQDPNAPLTNVTPERLQEYRARWVTNYFLIDAETGTCRKTTRLQQAIETLQMILWSSRTGLLQDTYPEIKLLADDFDEDWKWIGSYATWRAAMFMFIYPENILLPNLRKPEHKTPGFNAMVENLGINCRVTPKKAEMAVQDYINYFLDICNLEIECTCHALTISTIEGTNQKLFYMFAQGGTTNTIYWSTCKPEDESEYAQSFWIPLKKFEGVINIIGARPYNDGKGGRSLYLFVRIKESGQNKLAYSKYDLDNIGDWTDIETLDGPSEQWSALPDQICNQSYDNPIRFLFLSENKLYFRELNQEATDWIDGDWTPLKIIGGGEYSHQWHKFYPLSMAIFESSSFLITYNESDKRTELRNFDLSDYLSFTPPSAENYVEISDCAHWLAINPWNQPNSIYAFWRDANNKIYCGWTSNEAMETELNWASLNIYNEADYLMGVQEIAKQSGASQGFIVSRRSGRGDGRKGWFLDKLEPAICRRLVQMQSPQRIAPQRSQESMPEFDESEGSGAEMNLVYFDELHYYVPVYIALQLQKHGYFTEALDWFKKVYDYSRLEGERFLYPRLDCPETTAEGALTYERGLAWLEDPLDIHGIAADPQRTPPLTDQRFIIQSIVHCLFDYADAEFTFDTSESIARARDLYLQALSLLDTIEFQQPKNECDGVIAELELSVGTQIEDSEEYALWISIREDLKKINELDLLQKTIKAINKIMVDDETLLKCLKEARQVVDNALDEQENLSNHSICDLIRRGVLDNQIKRNDLLSHPSISNDVALLSSQDDSIQSGFIGISEHFCIPPNPVLWALRLHAELNLHKIRTCRNIAGMKRELEPYAAPTDITSGMPSIGAGGQLQLPGAITIVPTQYRYAVLMEKAKQLVSLAQQMEGAFLSTLEKYDAETYNQLKARQDARLACAGIKLQDLRVTEAGHGVTLATLQRERAEIQEDHFAGLIREGLLRTEEWARNSLIINAGLQFLVAYQTTGLAIMAGTLAGAIAGSESGPGAVLTALGGASAAASAAMSLSQTAYSSITGGIATTSSVLSMMASFERRRQDWEFQKQLAGKDIVIGNQQITIAKDREKIVGQEYNIAKMQADFADDVVEFLNNKFTSAELYDWMSGVLEGVYRYFLQQATAMAKLAENQLAFERQEVPPAYIQNDYWEAPSEGAMITSAEDNAVDRRGLTGSSRLLMDIYKLDQHAFETDKRKLQLTKTISLSRHDPFAFQRFVQTGVMVFETPIRMFDQDFPGHYLRLIKRVRTSVLALIPPTEGIKATLQSSGISRVVIEGNIFQETIIRRDPESVALTSPQNATGLFELQQESHMMLPFESSGVDMVWEFRMPRACNPFDFRTIADVLITIEYTALDSYDYRQQVVRQLERNVSADRAFSFRHQFPDQWYALNNPDQDNTPMAVAFEIKRGDFPPNIQGLNIQQLLLYFVMQDGKQLDGEITLQLTGQENGVKYGGSAAPIENVISTRSGNAAGWSSSLIDEMPAGNWELKLPDSQKIRSLFKNNEIEDILFVITYSGQTPEWPE